MSKRQVIVLVVVLVVIIAAAALIWSFLNPPGQGLFIKTLY